MLFDVLKHLGRDIRGNGFALGEATTKFGGGYVDGLHGNDVDGGLELLRNVNQRVEFVHRRANDDAEAAKAHEALRLLPVWETTKGIGAEKKPVLRRLGGAEFGHGFDGIAEAALDDLEIANSEAVFTIDQELHHREPMLGGSGLGGGLQWVSAGRKKDNFIETEGGSGASSESQVADMGRIEAAAEDADLHS
jgi:hypothetical protein